MSKTLCYTPLSQEAHDRLPHVYPAAIATTRLWRKTDNVLISSRLPLRINTSHTLQPHMRRRIISRGAAWLTPC